MKAKRYHTREEILSAIERAHKRAMAWAKRAEAAEQEADSLRDNPAQFKGHPYELGQKISDLRDQADKLWSMQRTTQNKALPRLSKKLAEFDTVPMSGLGRDIPR